MNRLGLSEVKFYSDAGCAEQKVFRSIMPLSAHPYGCSTEHANRKIQDHTTKEMR
jgi:hypothetical protein